MKRIKKMSYSELESAEKVSLKDILDKIDELIERVNKLSEGLPSGFHPPEK